ncbi:MAG: nucleoid occlusion protein [Tissierellales bacterium]|jgi:ParB family transcriptional regulator, chromosome partitioning protein|nr:nucleoid occlusion protein [Tissierellales bacterium]MBN2827213.1 nucleoid occlusion protein [Tissierellales bacterium]
MANLRYIETVNLDNIIPNQNQPRRNFEKEALAQLAESIKTYGVIQPISLKKHNDNQYEIIAGERRYRAAKIAGLDSIPSIIIEVEESDSAAIALIENLQREDLDFIEEANSYLKLMNLFNITQRELAAKIGKKQSTIANKIRILKLSNPIKEDIIKHKLSERHARSLLKIEDDNIQMKVLKKTIKNNLTVKETEKLIDDIIKKSEENQLENESRVKNFINYKIYVNTIKHAYREILKTGVSAKFEQNDYDDYIEIKVRIPKK